MPNWLFEILFFGGVFGVVAWSIIWRIVVFTAAGDIYEAVTRKPPAPTAPEDPDLKARALKMLAEAEASRLASHQT